MKPVDTVVVVMIDGMRPEALGQGRTMVLDRLIAEGISTMRGRTVMPSVTLPCHASLFYSMPPEIHGVTSNAWPAGPRPGPGLLEVMKTAGRRTLMFYSWEPLRDLAPPGALGESYMLSQDLMPALDADVGIFDLAVARLTRHDYSFAFLYFGSADIAGHQDGWMSPTYMQRIEDADQAVGRVLKVLPAESLVIVLADHGGHAKGHGSDCEQDMIIPVIVSGSEIPRGAEFKRPVSILDIAPTVAGALGVAQPDNWLGSSLLPNYLACRTPEKSK